MTKDVIDAIKGRKSIRKFKSEPIPEATIGRLLEAAVAAPSAGNRQPWHFYVVLSQKAREGLAKAAYDQHFVAQAPCCIVVCAEPQVSAERYGRRGSDLYCIQDTAAAVQNIMLAAYGYGLGTCWVGAFDERATAAVLGVDAAARRPVAIIPVGYPDMDPTPRPRKAVEDVTTIIR